MSLKPFVLCLLLFGVCIYIYIYIFFFPPFTLTSVLPSWFEYSDHLSIPSFWTQFFSLECHPLISKLLKHSYSENWASPVAQLVKNLPTMKETWVQCLGWEDPLEKGKSTHSSILAWRIPMGKEAWWAAVHGVTKNRTWLRD